MKKLKRKELPASHTKNSFNCFGPVAEKDGQFDDTMLCDMGCFTQDESDTNKYYHAAVVQSQINNQWYVYLEWGKVGNTTNDFQFYECSFKEEAIREYKSQLHSKNDKRGEWFDHPVLGKMLRAKAGKDCYLVRPQIVRTTGLDSAKNIANISSIPVTQAQATQKTNKHKEVESLLRDINVGTLDYARTSMSTGSIPTLDALNQARLICEQAAKTSDDNDLRLLSNTIYSLIPKKKSKGQPWLLSSDNIKSWLDDIDSYEDAINQMQCSTTTSTSEPFELEYMEVGSDIRKFIESYFKHATNNRHAWIPGEMVIKHVWKIIRSDSDRITPSQKELCSKSSSFKEKPIFQPERGGIDLTSQEVDLYNGSNTSLLIHGTRSVNVGGILRSTLKLPKQLSGVSINGAMFGGGIYFADDWRKSAGYTSLKRAYYASGSGAIQNRDAFMFLADVVLGQCYVPNGTKAFVEPPAGFHSVLGKANVSGVANNEFITYYTESNSLRYLVEFTNV
jgi:hypothetical protein